MKTKSILIITLLATIHISGCDIPIAPDIITEIYEEPVQVETDSLNSCVRDKEINTPNEIFIDATGGSGNYHFSIASGSLPFGLTLINKNNRGKITGMTTVSVGEYPVAIKVQDVEDSDFNATKTFYLNVKEIVPDNFEIDNDFDTGNTMSPGDSQVHTLHAPTDEDYIHINLSSETVLKIQTGPVELADDSDGEIVDTIIDVYDDDSPTFTLLYTNDDNKIVNKDNLYSRIIKTFTPGNYYIKVYPYNTLPKYFGDYEINIAELLQFSETSVVPSYPTYPIDLEYSTLWHAKTLDAYRYVGIFQPSSKPSVDSDNWSNNPTFTSEVTSIDRDFILFFEENDAGGNSHAKWLAQQYGDELYYSCQKSYDAYSNVVDFYVGATPTPENIDSYHWDFPSPDTMLLIKIKKVYIDASDTNIWVKAIVTFKPPDAPVDVFEEDNCEELDYLLDPDNFDIDY